MGMEDFSRGNQGTPEEIKKGEDMLNIEQKDLSSGRRGSSLRLERLGVNGYLEKEEFSKEGGDYRISGRMNGHEINMTIGNGGGHLTYGRIDGYAMTFEEIENFLKKYTNAASVFSSKDIERATPEGQRQKEQAFKDIGL